VPKTLPRDQLQARKEKAVRFVRDVLGDPDRADEIEEESLEDYAERRKITLTNPAKGNRGMATKRDLEQQVKELEDENQELQDRLDALADLVSGDDDEEEEGEDADDDSATTRRKQTRTDPSPAVWAAMA
jgi:hypothetical protein